MLQSDVDAKLARYYELKNLLDIRDAKIRNLKADIKQVEEDFKPDAEEVEEIREWLLEQHQDGEEYVIEEYTAAKVEVKILTKPVYDSADTDLVEWFLNHKPEAVKMEVGKAAASKTILALHEAGLDLPPNTKVDKVPTLYVTERKES